MSKSGPTKFGYVRSEGQLKLDPLEAPIRRRMFELFFEHRRKKTVAEILNAEGLSTRTGASFSGQTVGRLLNDKDVVGVPNRVEPLISEKLYTDVQNILTSQKGQAKRKPNHLFAGLSYCGCGGKMYVPSGSHKYTCRDCKAKVHKHDLEAVFIDQVRAHYRNNEEAHNLLTLLDRWSALSKKDKRALVETTAKHIVIDSNKVTLSLVALYKT